MKTTAIIAAGGIGKRMHIQENKLFIELLGRPVLSVTVSVFESTELLDEIVLVVPPDEMDRTLSLVKKAGFKKIKNVVSGGQTRQDSVYNGLQAISHDSDIVLIHDGARPFVTKEMIVRAVNEIKTCGAVIVAMPVKDTIKTVGEDGFVMNTLDRELLWQVQTPQVFKKDLIIEAHERAKRLSLQATDDSRLVERLGEKVKVIRGSYENIKITTSEDIKIAEEILRSRRS